MHLLLKTAALCLAVAMAASSLAQTQPMAMSERWAKAICEAWNADCP